MARFPFKLVTFDLNGTLLKLNGSVGRIYADFARRRGILANPDDLDAGFRASYRAMNETHPNFGATGIGWRKWWLEVVKNSFPKSTRQSENIESVANDLIEHFSTGRSWKCEDGAREVLHTLKDSDVELGVISNTDPRLHNILSEQGLSHFFSFVLTSYEAEIAKPDVEIFHRAGQLFSYHSCYPYEEENSLHIGNSYELDYLAAREAGWQSVLVNHKPPVNPPDNCLVFPNLFNLQEHLVKLRSSAIDNS